MNTPYLTADGWYGDPTAPRDIKETLIRSAALQIVATASFGHLMSLRNMPNKASSSLILLYSLGSIIFPLLPLAQLLRFCRSTIIRVCRNHSLAKEMRFCASACLGIYATITHQDGNTRPIWNIELSRMRRTMMRYDVLWVGRMVVLLALLVQFTGTAVLWVRRAYLYQASFRLWGIDTRNFEVAIPGMLVVLSSICIIALNTKWVILDDVSLRSPQNLDAQRPGNMQESFQGVPTSESFTPIHRGGLLTMSVVDSVAITSPMPQGSIPQNNSRRPSPFNLGNIKLLAKWKTVRALIFIYASLGRINSSLSDWVTRYYPLQLQWDLELAYLLHIGFYSLFCKSGSMKWMPHACQSLSRVPKDDFAFSILALQYDWEHTPRWRWLINDWLVSDMAVVFLAFYYLPCFVILLHYMLWAMAHPITLRYIPRNCKIIFSEIDFWLRSGRTILSLPLTILLLFPVLIQAFVIRLGLWEVSKMREPYPGYQGYRRPGYNFPAWALWKDPWADHMYII